MSAPRYRVLLIEDNPGDANLMCKALRDAEASIEVEVAENLQAGLLEIGRSRWDVVLSDLSLPDSHGLETVQAIRREAGLTPLIVLTSLDSGETALQSLNEGAQDYLEKDRVTGAILLRAIQYAIQRQQNAEMMRMVEQLRASERLLEKKNRRLARLYRTAHRFVDNVSHEFRTPLTVIIEYVSLLRDGVVGKLDEQQERMLDVVTDRAGDLNNMVNDMLDISKLETGMLGLCRRSVRVTDALSHVMASLCVKSTVKSIDLEFDIPDELPLVYCDDEKLGRVVINLVTNAIKFCGRPGKVSVWAKRDDANRQVMLGVTDNGGGIDHENLELIFGRFKQVGANPRGSAKGFGLGLNIAKELVHLNLGEINVASTCGEGSTFWFTIPYAEPREVMWRYANRIIRSQSDSSAVSLVLVRVPEVTEEGLAEDCHRFFNALLRRNDLAFTLSPHRWLLVLPEEGADVSRCIERMQSAREMANCNRPTEMLPRFAFDVLGTWEIPQRLESMLAVVDQQSQTSLMAGV